MRSVAVTRPSPRPIVGHIVLTLRAYKEGAQYVSECVELGTASCGDSIEEAFENVKDATLVYLRTLEETGQRQRVFQRRGIEIMLGPPHGDERPVRVTERDVVSLFVHELNALAPNGTPTAVL